MFGVVLWSDQVRKRAVIWCEDHGDLAFFSGDGVGALDGVDMEPGDLVQFDVRAERHLRLASNPRLVASDEYPTLANELKKAGGQPAPAAREPMPAMGKIIAFEPKSNRSVTQAGSRRKVC